MINYEIIATEKDLNLNDRNLATIINRKNILQNIIDSGKPSPEAIANAANKSQVDALKYKNQ